MDELNGTLNLAQGLAVFLRDFGPYAIAALALLFAVYKDRQARNSEQEKFELAMMIAPLAERLSKMLESAAQARRSRHSRGYDSSPPQENLHG